MSRLLDRIDYKITDSGCWECVSHKARRAGYPVFKISGKLFSGHRLVYEQEKGPIPKGMLVRHTCDNRECLNPDHLLLGTYKDNFEDMRRQRGINDLSTARVNKGSRNGQSKITENDVLKIRELLKQNLPGTVIAKKFNVTKSIISRIKTKTTWGWLK